MHDTLPLAGRTIVVTGATDGIGRVTAERLAQRGAQMVLVGRNPARLDATRQAIAAAASSAPAPITFCADLSAQAEIRRVTAEIRAAVPAVDVLVNNAGALFAERSETVDGIERTFALNHLGYFLFTAELLPALKAGRAPRIVNVASEAHRSASLVLDDLQHSRRSWSGWRAYCESKLANIAFTYALARRLEGSGVAVNCLHPGFVASSFGSSNGWISVALRFFMTFAAINVEQGAATSIFLAGDPSVDGASGGYYDKRRLKTSNAASRVVADQEALWAQSEALVGRSFEG